MTMETGFRFFSVTTEKDLVWLLIQGMACLNKGSDESACFGASIHHIFNGDCKTETELLSAWNRSEEF